MKILFCDNIAGVAGDMFASSFVDAGFVSEEELKSIPGKLGLPEVKLKFKKVQKAHISSTHLDVDLSRLQKHNHEEDHHDGSEDHHHHHHRDGIVHFTYREIIDKIDNADLTPKIKEISKSIYKLLAKSESEVHDVPIEEVHFHEVGSPDSLMDVVMAGYILEKIDCDEVYSTPVKLGRGHVHMEHGTYPVPPPATALLAEGFQIDQVPGAISKENVELSTPTGIAILKYLEPTFCRGWVKGKSLGHGYGAGSMDLEEYPNLFRIALFEVESEAPETTDLPYRKGQVIEISCNIDDQTPEKTGWCMEQLFELGALDVWMTPIHMKKNRLAVCLSVLVDEDRWEKLADWILRNTSTFGLRYKLWNKLSLQRDFEKRTKEEDTEITYKIGKTTDGEILKSKPEFDEVKELWDKK